MRILQLGKFYPIQGGVEKVMFDLLDGMSKQGITCDMLCANAYVGQSLRIIQHNDNSQIISTSTLCKKFATMISPQMVVELRKICSNYDIIHVHHPDPMAALALFFSGYKGKVVLHWHSDILKQKKLLMFFMPFQKWLIKRADVIVGTTPIYIAQSPHLQTVQEKCTYIPIGIEKVTDNKERTEAIKEKYSDKKIIFSLGRLVSYKGFEYLVDAANYLPDNCIVLIGGAGPLINALQEQIADCHLQEKVVLLGRVSDEDLPSYYAACDLYCLSSVMKTEAFAIVQLEAMSFGKPIVATNIPESGVSWVNAHQESGLNVPIKDGKALADAIIEILADNELYEKLSNGAKKRFNHLFQKEKMIETCLDIYKNTLELNN